MTALEWEEAAFATALKDLQVTGTIDASGKRIDRQQVARILRAAPHDAGRRYFNSADFRAASFRDDLAFERIRFAGEAMFDGASFAGTVDFQDAVFEREARFVETTFDRLGTFLETEFRGNAMFTRARFLEGADFDAARFSRDANFDGTQFSSAQFARAEFSGAIRADGASFTGDALFTDAAFRASVILGPLLVGCRLSFDGAAFEEDAQIRAGTARFSCIRTRFVGRADLKLRWAQVVLDDALFLQHSWLSGTPAFTGLDEESLPVLRDLRTDEHGVPHQERPRLLSMREANVAKLSLSDVDLRACRFSKAQGLDQLRLEANCEFAGMPKGWRHTKRRTLAEEHHWRSVRTPSSAEWHPIECQSPSWIDKHAPPVEILDPPRIATLYRSLRKALEDSKDEPGAGDFYYGEMEMRRQNRAETPGTRAQGRRIPGAERRIVSIYWFLSGYGLRASRALTLLVLLIAVSAVGLHLYGFEDPVRPYATEAELRAQRASGVRTPPRKPLDGLASIEAWTYSMGTATAIVGAPEAQLTQTGRAMRIALRILGPLLIGLALLSIRGRVKR